LEGFYRRSPKAGFSSCPCCLDPALASGLSADLEFPSAAPHLHPSPFTTFTINPSRSRPSHSRVHRDKATLQRPFLCVFFQRLFIFVCARPHGRAVRRPPRYCAPDLSPRSTTLTYPPNSHLTPFSVFHAHPGAYLAIRALLTTYSVTPAPVARRHSRLPVTRHHLNDLLTTFSSLQSSCDPVCAIH
jgi:hypothetical protein